jgi:hypothetical protein
MYAIPVFVRTIHRLEMFAIFIDHIVDDMLNASNMLFLRLLYGLVFYTIHADFLVLQLSVRKCAVNLLEFYPLANVSRFSKFFEQMALSGLGPSMHIHESRDLTLSQ